MHIRALFLYLSEAQASPKTITFIPGRDGKVYERRITGAGEFVTPAENITVLDEIRPGFHPSLPRIPYSLMEQAIGLFRTMMRKGKGRQPAEALVHFYWDKQEQRYFIRVPKQIVSGVSVDALLDDEELMTSDRYIHYADLHSHNRMPAVFSKTDDHDERATRLYGSRPAGPLLPGDHGAHQQRRALPGDCPRAGPGDAPGSTFPRNG